MNTVPAVVLAAVLGIGASNLFGAETKLRTVAALYKEKAALAGQMVSVKGKVVKANNGIMGRNFLHLRDGTGTRNDNDLTVTSQQTARVGEAVTVTGRVVLDRDFGSGYTYPLILEEARISK
jgi:hypothetical protein